jgi:hypothetical protein
VSSGASRATAGCDVGGTRAHNGARGGSPDDSRGSSDNSA